MPRELKEEVQSELTVKSIVSSSDRRGYVQVFKNGEPVAQLDPDVSREFGVSLLMAAEAAEADASLAAVLVDEIGLDERRMGAILMALRERRETDAQTRKAEDQVRKLEVSNGQVM